MLKYNLAHPEGFSGFMQALKNTFTNRNQDIRTTGTTKFLHAASEAQGLENWQQLSAILSKQTESPQQENIEEEKKNGSAFEDIIDICKRHNSGEDIDLSDLVRGSDIKTIELTFAISSSTSMVLGVDIDGEVTSGYVRTSGFGYGKTSIKHFEQSQLSVIEYAFSELISTHLSTFQSE